MTVQKSVVMLSNTSGMYTKTGDPIRADGWFGYTDGLHTVQLNYVNFKGSFGIQGTLSTNPTENDWFYININDGLTDVPYVTFDNETGVRGFSFIGNFIFLRAKLIRPEVYPEPDQFVIASLGVIDKVLLSM